MAQLKTHKPTGKVGWPILLLAGGEKCGKSYSAAQFSASDLVDRTFWFEIGEMIAEEYAPLGRYEIVDHDGSYSSIVDQLDAVLALPRSRKPHCIVIDSATKLWDLLTDEQTTIMKRRNKNTITVDQWNVAKKRWAEFFDRLRRHYGPVIITARYERVTVMDAKGQPTDEKEWKIKAEKNLGFDVNGTILMPTPRQYFLSGLTSLKFDIPVGGHRPLPDFTVDKFMRVLGVEDLGERTYTALKEDQLPDPQDQQENKISFADFEGAAAT